MSKKLGFDKASYSSELIDYLLWTAQNSPSKQHEGYYDLYWSADRKVLDELSKYTRTTHTRNRQQTGVITNEWPVYLMEFAKELTLN